MSPDPTKAREAAEASGDDAALLRHHDVEIALSTLPMDILGIRRGRLLWVDELSSTWHGWDLKTGAPVIVRSLRQRWHHDPVMSRRFVAGAPDHNPNPFPHMVYPVGGSLVCDWIPSDEDALGTMEMARLLTDCFQALSTDHAQQRFHGPTLAKVLQRTDSSIDIPFLDPFPRMTDGAGDLKALAALLAPLGLPGDPIRHLCLDWSQDPPPTIDDAKRLVVHTLTSQLLDARHRLAVLRRNRHHRAQIARLARAVIRLRRAMPPPQGVFCIHVTMDGLLTLIESQEGIIRGGTAGHAPAHFLPVVFAADRGLNPQECRTLLRAWATRRRGNEKQRKQTQHELGASDEQAELLMRWMAAMARLRAQQLLLSVVS